MSGIVVYAEQHQNTLKKVVLESISQERRMADELGLDLAVLIVGYNVLGLVDKERSYGANVIYLANGLEKQMSGFTEEEHHV